ncbi:histidine--tRNA ligase, partial [Thermodesulfobacteriota bacterium]
REDILKAFYRSIIPGFQGNSFDLWALILLETCQSKGGGEKTQLEFNTIKGFKDILPDEVGTWQMLESAARRIFECFGYKEIKPPLLEWTELFSRGIGEETDIVSKEMYTLYNSKGRGMTLRPEATASVIRACIQNRLYHQNPLLKLYTIGPMFRHEQPQHGRFRQFHQINAELFGNKGPKSDADLVVMAMNLFDAIGVQDLVLKVNSLGCPECRPQFRSALKDFLRNRSDALCVDCKKRSELNPLRVFDCKVEGCNRLVDDAPSIHDFLCRDCIDHFDQFQQYLNSSGIPFSLDHRLVRGLDYYCRTTFEIQTDRLGAQNAVAGGGRYDGLVKTLGGPDVPGIGFAVGIERLAELLESDGRPEQKRPDIFIAALGDRAEKECFKLAIELRKNGFLTEMDYDSKGLKAQMKRAGKLGSERVLIVGDEELTSGKAVLRDMNSKEQEEVDLNNILQKLKDIIHNDGNS